MSKILTILGAGESGIGAAILGKKHGYVVFLSDAGNIASDRKATLQSLDVDFEEGGHDQERILSSDVVVKSPGIPDKAPLIQALINKGVSVISEIEFAYQHMDAASKVIAITGTNGKTTTTLLTYHLLKQAGYDVALGGNVGVSLAKLVAEKHYDYYVVEISSFQLDGIVKFKPTVAVLLNITPDHLDRYEYDFSKYVDSKFRIIENQSSAESLVYCVDSQPVSEQVAKRTIDACLFAVSSTKDTRWQACLEDDHLIFNYTYKGKDEEHSIPVSEISLIGKHNMINSMCAVLSALNVNVPIADIMKGLKSFVNAPHRLEPCGEIDGVRFINDSKATNVDAVYYALDGIKSNIVWIAGGTDKGNDYTQLKSLVKDKVKGLICLGVDNEKLKAFFGEDLGEIHETRDVNEGVALGLKMAAPGDVVLLSPACASFDLFKNYEHRGDLFRAAVKALLDTKKVSA